MARTATTIDSVRNLFNEVAPNFEQFDGATLLPMSNNKCAILKDGKLEEYSCSSLKASLEFIKNHLMVPKVESDYDSSDVAPISSPLSAVG